MESVYKLELPEGWKPPFNAAVIVQVSDDPIASNEYEVGNLPVPGVIPDPALGDVPPDDYREYERWYGLHRVPMFPDDEADEENPKKPQRGNLASNLNWSANVYVYSPCPHLRRKFRERTAAEAAADELVGQFLAAGVPVKRVYQDEGLLMLPDTSVWYSFAWFAWGVAAGSLACWYVEPMGVIGVAALIALLVLWRRK